MKFIITESSMSRVVSLYLNNKKFDMIDSEKKFDSYAYFFEKGKDKKKYGVSEIAVYKKNRLGETRNWVYINFSLIEEVSTLFTISEKDSLEMIGEWVANKLDIVPQQINSTRREGGYRLIMV